MEVYQDQVRDLLINPNEDGTTRMPAIDIRESPAQGVFLEGVRYAIVPPVVIKLAAKRKSCLLWGSLTRMEHHSLI